MATLTPGQEFLGGLLNSPGFVADMIATTRPELEDESYRRAREIMDGSDYKFPKEFPTGPKPGTDPLTGMPLPKAQWGSMVSPQIAQANTGLVDWDKADPNDPTTYPSGIGSGEPAFFPGPPPAVPGSVQEIPVVPWQDNRHTPFEGQWTSDGAGNRVPRTPENTIPGP